MENDSWNDEFNEIAESSLDEIEDPFESWNLITAIASMNEASLWLSRVALQKEATPEIKLLDLDMMLLIDEIVSLTQHLVDMISRCGDCEVCDEDQEEDD